MRKILAGFLMIIAVASVVAGSASALFSSSTTVSGITFATGNAKLQVWDWTANAYADTWTANLNFSGMYPGYSTATVYNVSDIWLKNTSTAAISLDLTTLITAGIAGETEDLKYAAQVSFQETNLAGTPVGAQTTWASLKQVATTGVTLPGGSLAQGAQRGFRMYVRVPAVYEETAAGDEDGDAVWAVTGVAVGNEIASESLPGVTFTFTGTQAP